VKKALVEVFFVINATVQPRSGMIPLYVVARITVFSQVPKGRIRSYVLRKSINLILFSIYCDSELKLKIGKKQMHALNIALLSLIMILSDEISSFKSIMIAGNVIF
jgi:hypothetical protein